ncbi:GyrI-like domain-containing protein [Oceanobacillus sp. Castelsardo]|uniref:GyrI-like domain-containing protein n=1 Tax=Oceanobacillus sp. Castelsardo TaxID=1851204 RepID=UPI0008387398|nr:effector binding domain-containing protein [Oceanobacillus sp. Castelsardo]
MKLAILNSIRTNNFDDELVMQKITDMWKEASKDLAQHETNTYGVYYDYESDYTGDYSLSVAIEGEKEPCVTIANDQKYEAFTVDTSDEQGILKMWSEIWDKEKAGKLQRAYTIDFEKYHPNGTIEIYIAVK